MALQQEFNSAGDLWIGPDSAKSNVSADSGRVYWATDQGKIYYGDSGSWVDQSTVNDQDISPSGITNSADIIVDDGDDIDQAFTDISQGDTMVVGQPATPYRSDDWLEPGVDDFTIIFQSRFAEDGQAIVKCADGANVGGIRIGNSSTRSGWNIRNFGFDGNEANQTSGTDHTAIQVDDATKFLIDGTYATRTHPYHEHGSGGSGIKATTSCSEYTIRRSNFYEIGDRGVASQGTDWVVNGVVSQNGYDRAVSVDQSAATRGCIANVRGDTHDDGSCIGISGGENITVNAVHAKDMGGSSGGKELLKILGGSKVNASNLIAENCSLLQIDGATDITLTNGQTFDPNLNVSHGVRMSHTSNANIKLANLYLESTFRGVTVAAANTSVHITDCHIYVEDGGECIYDDVGVVFDNCKTEKAGTTGDDINANGNNSVFRDHTFVGSKSISNTGSATILDDVTV